MARNFEKQQVINEFQEEQGKSSDSAVAAHEAAANPHPQYAAAAHTHVIADVTGLQAILDDFEARISALETP